MSTTTPCRAVIYARVSTLDQQRENQLNELRRHVEARRWSPVEYVDHGISGAKEKRPALDALVKDARRRKVDVLVCWRLDRLGRNLRHLVTLLDELQSICGACVSLGEVIECTTHVFDQRLVPDSGGHQEVSWVIETRLEIGTQTWPIEMTLTARDDMLFRMLLGRTAIANRATVHPARSYLQGKRRRRRETPA